MVTNQGRKMETWFGFALRRCDSLALGWPPRYWLTQEYKLDLIQSKLHLKNRLQELKFLFKLFIFLKQNFKILYSSLWFQTYSSWAFIFFNVML